MTPAPLSAWSETPRDALGVMGHILKNKIPFSLDTETTGLRVKDGTDICIGVSVAANVGLQVVGSYIPLQHFVGQNARPEVVETLVELVETADSIIFQNAKFDVHSLLTVGIDARDAYWYDCAVMSNMIDENAVDKICGYKAPKTLDNLTLTWLGKRLKITDDEFVEAQKKSGNREIEPWQMERYATMDAVGTYLVGEVLIDRLYAEELDELWWYKQRVLKLLQKMEARGIRIDQDKVIDAIAEGEIAMEDLVEQIGVNPKSNKQLKELLIDRLHLPVLKRTPKGEPSFTKETMPAYDDLLSKTDSPLASQITAYRGWQTAIGLSLKPFLEKVSPDGRLRCNYNLDVTKTGRFSASDPNLQQVPKEGDKPWKAHTKSCFVPEDGYVLVNIDYSQLELRLGTLYADEPALKRVFEEGRDIFTEMSETLGFDRQTTKTFVYSTQYGAGTKRIMGAFGVTAKRANEMLALYKQAYPRFVAFSESCARMAEKRLEVKLWSGRKRHFQYQSESYKAMNSVIQGGSADLMERTMLRLEDEIDSEDCRMLLQIHDAILWEIREDLVEEMMPKIKAIFEDVASSTGEDVFNQVVFASEIGPDYGSKHWGEAGKAA